MKKLLALWLALLTVTGLIGCSEAPPQEADPDFTEHSVIVGDPHSDIEGISVQISGVYTYTDKTELVIVWSNKTEYAANSEGSFDIECFKNGQWVSCALKEKDGSANSFDLPPNKTKNIIYDITDMYDLSKPGRYRFISSCKVETEENKEAPCSVWMEFTIE